ncbi:MAG: L,D-transpeptidase [Acidobacteriota bacterium]
MTESEGVRPEFPAQPPAPQGTPPRRGGVVRVLRALVLLLLFVGIPLICLGLFVFLSTGYRYSALREDYVLEHTAPPRDPPPGMTRAKAVSAAEASLAKIRPKGVFIVIDRVKNLLHLREGDAVLLTAVISAGAGSVLDDPKTGRRWVFDTPAGRFYVKGKRENPVWVAPDWDYIESGEPIPKRHSDRIQEGMLGEYALDLGGGPPGYMIHGTLYTRLLGKNVSHGCIRVGRDDLRVIWKKVPVGAAVFMY